MEAVPLNSNRTFCPQIVEACYYEYKVARRKEQTDSSIDFSSLEHHRNRRYVDTVIPRLADNYVKPAEKDEFGFDGSRRRNVNDMLGNVAIRAEPLTSANDPGAKPVPSHQESEAKTQASIPDETVTPALPAVTPMQEKREPVENKDLLSKASKKILANSPPKATSTNNNANAPVNVSFPDVKTGSDSNVYSVPELTDYPKDVTNSTLKQHNITKNSDDYHVYYNSTFLINPTVGKQLWVDMSTCPNVTINDVLSKSHRRATTIKLTFDFPFYGHMVRNVAIATGGFLYTGDYIHSWLAATQYIAPLMANFDTSMSNNSHVKYCDNGTAFTVEWEKVLLQDKADAGEFTFQVTLHKSGDIIFVYKNVPILVETIEDSLHPVKIGLSDAYIIDRTVFFVRRKTIYEYHRVNFPKDDIKNWTVIQMTALPTCLDYKTCESCVNHETGFDCKWCPEAERCSSGYDRHRQDWQWKQCEVTSVGGPNATACADAKLYKQLKPSLDGSSNHQMSIISGDPHPQVATVIQDSSANRDKSGGFGHTGTLGLLLLVLMISGLGLWVLYAYHYPHTQSGQVLIKYRPSQWALRRGEARYTAASIHM
ncbi:PSI [Nesidiocoris tenuis]|uniref:PSI n=1 Tax=Nesidiocoris tenuis TaxID=355587 RepID=A0ABN7B6V1_9HEMI|nr:PSI [Nesidiocoris tenuis]